MYSNEQRKWISMFLAVAALIVSTTGRSTTGRKEHTISSTAMADIKTTDQATATQKIETTEVLNEDPPIQDLRNKLRQIKRAIRSMEANGGQNVEAVVNFRMMYTALVDLADDCEEAIENPGPWGDAWVYYHECNDMCDQLILDMHEYWNDLNQIAQDFPNIQQANYDNIKDFLDWLITLTQPGGASTTAPKLLSE